MSVFGRIKRQTFKRFRRWFWQTVGFLSALGFFIIGGINRLKTHLEALDADIEQRSKELLETDEDVLFSTIGRALTYWSTMEEVLVYIFALLLRADFEKAGLILYSTINFSVWISMIDELFAIDDHFKSFKPRWNKLVSRARSLKDERDRLAHHSVRRNPETKELVAAIQPGRMDVRQKSLKYAPMDKGDIIEFTSRLNEFTSELLNLLNDMNKSVRPSSRCKSPE
jgi:hypothetical protein